MTLKNKFRYPLLFVVILILLLGSLIIYLAGRDTQSSAENQFIQHKNFSLPDDTVRLNANEGQLAFLNIKSGIIEQISHKLHQNSDSALAGYKGLPAFDTKTRTVGYQIVQTSYDEKNLLVQRNDFDKTVTDDFAGGYGWLGYSEYRCTVENKICKESPKLPFQRSYYNGICWHLWDSDAGKFYGTLCGEGAGGGPLVVYDEKTKTTTRVGENQSDNSNQFFSGFSPSQSRFIQTSTDQIGYTSNIVYLYSISNLKQPFRILDLRNITEHKNAKLNSVDWTLDERTLALLVNYGDDKSTMEQAVYLYDLDSGIATQQYLHKPQNEIGYLNGLRFSDRNQILVLTANKDTTSTAVESGALFALNIDTPNSALLSINNNEVVSFSQPKDRFIDTTGHETKFRPLIKRMLWELGQSSDLQITGEPPWKTLKTSEEDFYGEGKKYSFVDKSGNKYSFSLTRSNKISSITLPLLGNSNFNIPELGINLILPTDYPVAMYAINKGEKGYKLYGYIHHASCATTMYCERKLSFGALTTDYEQPRSGDYTDGRGYDPNNAPENEIAIQGKNISGLLVRGSADSEPGPGALTTNVRLAMFNLNGRLFNGLNIIGFADQVPETDMIRILKNLSLIN